LCCEASVLVAGKRLILQAARLPERQLLGDRPARAVVLRKRGSAATKKAPVEGHKVARPPGRTAEDGEVFRLAKMALAA
jgi:hypothetical protein